MNQAAIVTLAIGQPYLANWQKYCSASWQAYSQKHNFDLHVITQPLDRSSLASSRSPAWQKCLVLSQDFAQRYRQVVLLDSDIVINTQDTPNIIEQSPIESVGGVISGSHIQEDLRIVLLRRLGRGTGDYQRGPQQWQEDQAQCYRKHGLAPCDDGIIQTGVLVASPQHHSRVFEAVYTRPFYFEDRSYEQIPLSHALLSTGLFHRIDTRFNSVFFETLAIHYPYLLKTSLPSYSAIARHATRTEYENNFFLHFAYVPPFMEYLLD